MKKILIYFNLFFDSIFCFTQAPDIEWQNTIGGISSDELTICQTRDGGYIVGGSSQSGPFGDKTALGYGNQDYWILKLDSIGNIQWQNSYGGDGIDILNELKQTSDGGFILAGKSNSDISGNKTEGTIVPFSIDYWVVKLDSLGNIVWQNDIGGSGTDELYSVDQTFDGGYILGGWSNSPISGDKTEANYMGSEDIWIVRLDSLGNIVWQNDIGGSGQDFIYSILHCPDGGYIACGKSNSGISGDKTEINFGSEDYWVLKLDSLGGIVWQKTIGGSQLDRPYKILQTVSNMYIVAGFTSSSISGNKTEPTQGENDFWVISLDSTGNIIWQKDIGGSLSDILRDFFQTSDGGYILGGYSSSNISGDKTENNIGFEDYWVIKLDNIGNILWQKTIGGWSADYLIAIQQTQDSGYIIGGWSDSPASGDKTENNIGASDFWIVKLYLDSCDKTVFYFDMDGDEFGNSVDSTLACFAPFGFIANAGDCNDTVGEINPSASEICNSFDDNCDGNIDEGLPVNLFYVDADTDGYGNVEIDTATCLDGISGYVVDSTDCDDGNNLIHEAMTYFSDEDNDSFGNYLDYTLYCDLIPPLGYVNDSTDCDDSNPNIYPGAIEILNGFDDDCDDSIDEGVLSLQNLIAPNFLIYPNPNNGVFEIKLLNINEPDIRVQIFAVTGNEIYSGNFHKNDPISIRLANPITGVFDIYISDGYGFARKTIIIQKQ